MTTGFNIASDISNDLEFNSMIGLTHEEVKELLNDVVLGKDREKIYQLMIENYDGYLFHKDANERVFNATLVMYLLNYYQRYQSIPESLMDKNIVSNYGKIGNLLKLQNNAYYVEILEQLLKEGMVIGELNNNFNLLVPFTEDDIISLLYYFGYLTIKEEGFGSNIYFQIPNKVMQKVYGNYFLQLLNDNNITISSTVIDEIIREIALEGKVSKVTQNVSEILKQVDNRILIKFDEKYIQIMYFILLQGAKEFNLWTEYPSKNGYIDLYIEGNPKYMKQNIIIEFKYIKVSDRNEELLEEKIKEAKEQIERYSEDERLHQPLQKYIIVFSGSECLYIENVK